MPGRAKIRQCLLVPFRCKGSQILLKEPNHADEIRTIIALEYIERKDL